MEEKEKIEDIITKSYKNYLNVTIAHNKREFLYPKYFKMKNYLHNNFINLLLFYRKIKIFFYFAIEEISIENINSFNKEFDFLKTFLRKNK